MKLTHLSKAKLFLAILITLIPFTPEGNTAIYSCKNEEGQVVFTDKSSICENPKLINTKTDDTSNPVKAVKDTNDKTYILDFSPTNSFGISAYYKGKYIVLKNEINIHFESISLVGPYASEKLRKTSIYVKDFSVTSIQVGLTSYNEKTAMLEVLASQKHPLSYKFENKRENYFLENIDFSIPINHRRRDDLNEYKLRICYQHKSSKGDGSCHFYQGNIMPAEDNPPPSKKETENFIHNDNKSIYDKVYRLNFAEKEESYDISGTYTGHYTIKQDRIDIHIGSVKLHRDAIINPPKYVYNRIRQIILAKGIRAQLIQSDSYPRNPKIRSTSNHQFRKIEFTPEIEDYEFKDLNFTIPISTHMRKNLANYKLQFAILIDQYLPAYHTLQDSIESPQQ